MICGVKGHKNVETQNLYLRSSPSCVLKDIARRNDEEKRNNEVADVDCVVDKQFRFESTDLLHEDFDDEKVVVIM